MGRPNRRGASGATVAPPRGGGLVMRGREAAAHAAPPPQGGGRPPSPRSARRAERGGAPPWRAPPQRGGAHIADGPGGNVPTRPRSGHGRPRAPSSGKIGVEPITSGFEDHCSTIELLALACGRPCARPPPTFAPLRPLLCVPSGRPPAGRPPCLAEGEARGATCPPRRLVPICNRAHRRCRGSPWRSHGHTLCALLRPCAAAPPPPLGGRRLERTTDVGARRNAPGGISRAPPRAGRVRSLPARAPRRLPPPWGGAALGRGGLAAGAGGRGGRLCVPASLGRPPLAAPPFGTTAWEGRRRPALARAAPKPPLPLARLRGRGVGALR